MDNLTQADTAQAVVVQVDLGRRHLSALEHPLL
jgi:hypothetical protein